MGGLLALSGVVTGDTLVSPHIDVSASFEISYAVEAEDPSENFQLSIRLEALDAGTWRALQTARMSRGVYRRPVPVSGEAVVRLVLICLSGAAGVSATTFDRPMPTRPVNFALIPNSLLYISETQEIEELDPPTEPNSYLGTDVVNEFGWHVLPAASGGAQINWGDIPSGTIDGVNDTFELASTPLSGTQIHLVLNGLGMTEEVDYTRSGKTFVYHSDQIPETGDGHKAIYQIQ